jgi:hypothetical protein
MRCRVTVVEAKELLGTFDGSLREYAARKLVAQGVKLRKVRQRVASTLGHDAEFVACSPVCILNLEMAA